MNVIWSLCRKYTDLSDEEIRIIEHMSETLQPLANLEGADIFIDCPGRDGNAIVVAEAKPECVPSSYKNTVVGLLAKPENEPAVARTFRLGLSIVQTLVKDKLRGNLEIESGPEGTCARFDFKNQIIGTADVT